MTDTLHRGGRAETPARRGPVPDTSAAGRAAELLSGLRGGPAPAWLRVLATTGLVTAFVLWGLLFGVGAESMYLLSDYVGEDQSFVMAASSVTLTAVGVPLLLVRHRRPVLVAGVIGALAALVLLVAGAGNGYELAVAAALYAVAAARSPRTTWVVAAAVTIPLLALARFAPRVGLVGGLAMGDRPDEADSIVRVRLPGVLGEALPPSWLATAAPFIVLALLGVAFGVAARDARLRAAEALKATAARAAEEEQRARVTQADERARVAREMHDVIAHSITVMIALGGGAAAALDKSPEQARRALDELVDTGRVALEDVRRILGVLHSPDPTTPGTAAGGPHGTDDDDEVPMAPAPGVEDLDRLVERFRTAGLPVRTAGLAAAGLDGLDATVQLAVFRIVQESLTNTLRHAPGTASVDVAVRRLADAVEVVVADRGPGHGADPVARTSGSGRGVAGMTGRVAAFGGTLEAGPYRGGWRVRALLPQPGGAPGAPQVGDAPSDDTAVTVTTAPATNEGEA
ncbi:sensor histidine kinase [Cellulomonas dongxiuzhuiae]|uniref:sensor histidine kinase n=1 Tax=Cellulomonas dongxiuzhuiae TaxID=2819979 RepID=UPI001AAEED33|nr:histidine kinase [Cellulomonas dongxiuzhuiae]MBO3089444.1 two-component sensor histidine kinase [Cellulomonas dongxiuzhuiae]